MNTNEYKPLYGDSFHESFLMGVAHQDWPNEVHFFVWSTQDSCCYRIETSILLEFHFLRTGVGRLGNGATGIPLNDIYVTYEEEFAYWTDRIQDQGYCSEEGCVCVEFASPLLANRRRRPMVRDRNMGMLVVCRNVAVKEEHAYRGSMPQPYRIPSK